MSNMQTPAVEPKRTGTVAFLPSLFTPTSLFLSLLAATATGIGTLLFPLPIFLISLLPAAAALVWRYGFKTTLVANVAALLLLFVCAVASFGAYETITQPLGSAKHPVWGLLASWLLFIGFAVAVRLSFEKALESAVSDTIESAAAAELESSQIVEIAELVVSSDTERVVLVSRYDGTIVYASPGAERAFELSEADLLKTSLTDLFPTVDIDDLAKDSAEGFARPVEGTRRAERRTFVALAFELSTPGLYLFSAKDVSRVEASVQDQIDAAIAAQEAKVELSQAERVKSDLVSVVSHELRTPVTSILGYAEIIEGKDYGDLPAAYSNAAAVIVRNANRLLDLTEDLLDLTRIKEGVETIAQAPVEVSDIVNSAVSSLTPVSEARGVTLAFNIAATPKVKGRVADIERVLLNLLSNAIKFTPEMGMVTVELSEVVKDDDMWACISVQDTGLGISEEDINKLFTPFFRTSQAQLHAVQGTGLGLSIVRELVEALSGVIEVESDLAKGSTFRVYLPSVPLDVESPYRSSHLGSLHAANTKLTAKTAE